MFLVLLLPAALLVPLLLVSNDAHHLHLPEAGGSILLIVQSKQSPYNPCLRPPSPDDDGWLEWIVGVDPLLAAAAAAGDGNVV